MSQLESLLEQMQRLIDQMDRRIEKLEAAEYNRNNSLYLLDGIGAPSAVSGWAILFVDGSDGDLKITFEDSTTKTIVTDT